MSYRPFSMCIYLIQRKFANGLTRPNHLPAGFHCSSSWFEGSTLIPPCTDTVLPILRILSFFTGMMLNVPQDYPLLTPTPTACPDHNGRRDVQRPKRGLCGIVVCPYYDVEIEQWMFWARACGTCSASAFAVYIAQFLGARAIVVKECYLEAGDHDVIHVKPVRVVNVIERLIVRTIRRRVATFREASRAQWWRHSLWKANASGNEAGYAATAYWVLHWLGNAQ